MRTFRAVAATVLSAVVLAGCGASGTGGDDAPAASAPAPQPAPGGSTPAGPGPGPGSGPGGTGASGTTGPGGSSGPATPAPPEATGAPATPAGTPSAAETLVRVSRSGGFAGDTHTLLVKGDGSWTRLDRLAKPEGAGKLSDAGLARLRTALREADFSRLPRISTGGPKVFDGFSFAFVHGGHEVAGAQESLPPVLTKVLEALPPFTAG
ncbi:hypothetical protein [Streptomyces xanthophaeus]|uniref:hypothetical protein n=1 Tax=Streptomyces xanthophaeus TaxID=67385 RepID=UPI00131A64ED|nr:hypothetical protein [Streptomyces xanthophaeus]